MGLKERVYSVLVVSSAKNFSSAVSDMLPESKFSPIVYSDNLSSAKRTVAQRSFDFIIINAPLSDDLGVRFAIDCSTSGNSIVLFLIKNDIHSEVYEKLSPHGVFTLPKPMSKQTMDTALRWMITAKEKMKTFENKTTSMEGKMKEVRLLNKAKWLLISKEDMLEPEAHRYLEKEAMDRCVPKRQVAQEIIDKYEDKN